MSKEFFDNQSNNFHKLLILSNEKTIVLINRMDQGERFENNCYL